MQTGAIQSKRLVLLTYLALVPRRAFIRRDTLLGLFWPELPTDQARHALRQSLHYLRTTLGRDVVVGRGGSDVAVPAHALWCDADEFQSLVSTGDHDGALALYRDDLLEGVFITDAAAELEQWLDAERQRLRRMAAGASAAASAAASSAGRIRDAADYARRAFALDPDDEGALRTLVELLDRQGDRAGALRAYTEFEQRLRDEYDTAPSEATRKVRQRLGLSAPLPPVSPVPAAASHVPSEAAAPASVSAPTPQPGSSTRVRLVAVAAIAIAAVLVLLGIVTRERRGPAAGREVVAVGVITTDGDTAKAAVDAARALRSLLTTDLSQLSGVRVLSEGRLYEMVARAGGSVDVRDHVLLAARRAGATEMVEGTLHRREGGGYRLELQRVGVDRGTVSGAMVLEAARLGDLVTQATSQIAAAHRVALPVRALGELTSQSLLARSSYQRGLRAMYGGDRDEALRHFNAALEIDSQFAAAAYYAANLTAFSEALGPLMRQVARAAEAADSAPERERLQIRTLWAMRSNDPRQVAYAESLANRYPAEPEGRYRLGMALVHAGDFLGGIEQLREAIAVDSALFATALASDIPCWSCDAMRMVAQTYILMDSMDAAARWVDAWRRANPADHTSPVMYRAVLLDVAGRRADAVALVRDSMDAAFRAAVQFDYEMEWAIRAGDFAEAERLIAAELASSVPQRHGYAYWWKAILLRTRGQNRAALKAIDQFCSLQTPSDDCAQLRGYVLAQLGRAGEGATALRRRLAVTDPNSVVMPGLSARRRTWLLTHLGTMLAASGDTMALARVADSAERMGRLSAYGRDRRLHHYLRGLLAMARGQTALAERSFQAAEWSPIYDFSNSRYLRAVALLQLERPADAAAVLDPLKRRVVNSMGSYLSQADVHALLAEALLAAGRRAEAEEHLAWVARAWEQADPQVAARLATLRQRFEGP